MKVNIKYIIVIALIITATALCVHYDTEPSRHQADTFNDEPIYTATVDYNKTKLQLPHCIDSSKLHNTDTITAIYYISDNKIIRYIVINDLVQYISFGTYDTKTQKMFVTMTQDESNIYTNYIEKYKTYYPENIYRTIDEHNRVTGYAFLNANDILEFADAYKVIKQKRFQTVITDLDSLKDKVPYSQYESSDTIIYEYCPSPDEWTQSEENIMFGFSK